MSKLRRRRVVYALIPLWLLFSSPLPVHAAEATLSEIIVSNTQDDLLVFFEIRGCFTHKMEEATEPGRSGPILPSLHLRLSTPSSMTA